MKKQFEDVGARFGAPMGRRDYIDNDEAKVELFRVRFVDGDYDDGGAYWGNGGDPLFCARGDEVELFIRAENWQQAKEFLLDDWPKLKVLDRFDIEAMVTAYLECALWSSTECDEDGENCRPLDDQYHVDDFSQGAVHEAREDCEDLVRMCLDEGTELLDAARMGHDFWLTRNHHGAGFWDRGLGEQGNRLTALAHSFGEVDPFTMDDQVHFS